MFGYVTINRQELKVKDLENYQACYCGLCERMRARNGILSTTLLNYDMTFLALVLDGVYEPERKNVRKKCPMHPLRQKYVWYSEALDYAADMNLLLSYHKLADDWRDEKKFSAFCTANALRKRYVKVARCYQRQRKAIRIYLEQLHACEAETEIDLERAATLTGNLMAEIYAWKDDVWKKDLWQMGFYIGKFIYLMDAYEDVEKDQKKRNYNPFSEICMEEDFEERARTYMELMMSGCSRAFEMLPVIRNCEIIRNILYSGVWMNYGRITRKRRKQSEGMSDDGSV